MKFKQHEIDTDTTETKNLLMKFQEKLCVQKEHKTWSLKTVHTEIISDTWMKNVTCHISKQRTLQPPRHQPLPRPATVHPEGVQDGKAQDTGPRELRCASRERFQ